MNACRICGYADGTHTSGCANWNPYRRPVSITEHAQQLADVEAAFADADRPSWPALYVLRAGTLERVWTGRTDDDDLELASQWISAVGARGHDGIVFSSPVDYVIGLRGKHPGHVVYALDADGLCAGAWLNDAYGRTTDLPHAGMLGRIALVLACAAINEEDSMNTPPFGFRASRDKTVIDVQRSAFPDGLPAARLQVGHGVAYLTSIDITNLIALLDDVDHALLTDGNHP